jgi:quinol-cytochrome oxidoreductase complex cytochrome b subunit
MAAAGTVIWFVLNALLWYARPGELVWFAGSILLAVAYFTGFFLYVTRPK